MKKSFTPYSHSPLLTITEGFNWSLSDSVDRSSISVSNQSNELHLFLKNFIRAKFFYPGTADQYWHLIQNLQCTIKSYNNYVVYLNSKINQLQKELKKTKNVQTTENVVERYLCPVCLDTFTTIVDLDDHISKIHNDISDRWNSLRSEKINDNRNINVTIPQQSNSFDKSPEKQNSSEDFTNINELHQWMVDKFNLLEEMVYSNRERRRHHRHHHHQISDNINTTTNNTFQYQDIENPDETIINNLNNQTENNHPSQIDASPFHKSDKHIFNLTSSNSHNIPISTPNRKLAYSNDSYILDNPSEKSIKKSSSHNYDNDDDIENLQSDNTKEGHFIEVIENNNNHNIFNYSTTLSKKAISKSDDSLS
ncbi:hypothetical protein M9Y10_045701 [Tritrichomonas musculus]|uniref:C2H2-type domain-containing protein n=1 Tax=Tritrichomonas musculus TaxID=1915356 RepID=A0ABR2JX37_9EUKA